MKPNKGLSTPVVFRHLDYDQLSRVEPTHLLKQFVEEGLAEAEYVNDLELPAFKAMPSLQTMKAELEVRTAVCGGFTCRCRTLSLRTLMCATLDISVRVQIYGTRFC